LKVIIQIPCFNEEASLGITLQSLPRKISGVDEVEWLVIDDGSQDRTSEVALAHGVDHVVRFPKHLGLSAAYLAGLKTCIDRGADIIVNTDGDNQYCAADIPRLLEPILAGRSQFVLGARPLLRIPEFSYLKRALHLLGSLIMSGAVGQHVSDPTTGFRAMTRGVASRMRVYNRYTYTLETLIQMGFEKVRIYSVPIHTNRALRPSRLIQSLPQYLFRSVGTIAVTWLRYVRRPAFSLEMALGSSAK
jgi:glycosyltransferase involved in cell wall biosynthesis